PELLNYQMTFYDVWYLKLPSLYNFSCDHYHVWYLRLPSLYNIDVPSLLGAIILNNFAVLHNYCAFFLTLKILEWISYLFFSTVCRFHNRSAISTLKSVFWFCSLIYTRFCHS